MVATTFLEMSEPFLELFVGLLLQMKNARNTKNSSSQLNTNSFHHLCVTLPQQSFQHSSVGQVSRKTLLKLTRKNATQMSMTQLQTQMQMTRAFLFKFLADLICVFFTIAWALSRLNTVDFRALIFGHNFLFALVKLYK